MKKTCEEKEQLASLLEKALKSKSPITIGGEEYILQKRKKPKTRGRKKDTEKAYVITYLWIAFYSECFQVYDYKIGKTINPPKNLSLKGYVKKKIESCGVRVSIRQIEGYLKPINNFIKKDWPTIFKFLLILENNESNRITIRKEFRSLYGIFKWATYNGSPFNNQCMCHINPNFCIVHFRKNKGMFDTLFERIYDVICWCNKDHTHEEKETVLFHTALFILNCLRTHAIKRKINDLIIQNEIN